MSEQRDEREVRTVQLRDMGGVTVFDLNLAEGAEPQQFLVGRIPRLLAYASLLDPVEARRVAGVNYPIAIMVLSRPGNSISREVLGYLRIDDLQQMVASLSSMAGQ